MSTTSQVFLEQLQSQSEAIWAANSIHQSMDEFASILKKESNIEFCSYFQVIQNNQLIELGHSSFQHIDPLPKDCVEVVEQNIKKLLNHSNQNHKLVTLKNSNTPDIQAIPMSDKHVFAWVVIQKDSSSPVHPDPKHTFLSTQLSHKVQLLDKVEKNKNLAYCDELTGLFNYRYFWNILQNEISRFERYSKAFSILFMDLNQFKGINDQHGHLVGDEALQEFSKILKKCIRNVDTVARYGGDEFIILLNEANEASAQVVINRIQNTLVNYNSHQGKDYLLKADIGIAEYPKHGKTEKELIHHADQNAYRSKNKKKENK